MMATSAQRLLAEVLPRYGSVEAFIAELRRAAGDPRRGDPGPEHPTLELPPAPAHPADGAGGRHRRPDSE
ncbi:hypothetical protein [Nocardia sp. NPDC127526]|uniref:hypothetical protein n=1 Tax=Nocardia sp. NPDC127526 TaxID=3345393 RepID=UPI00363568A3